MMTETKSGSSLLAILGVVVTRVLVPLWLLTGVSLTLADGSASHLPASLIKWLGPTGIDLLFVLHFAAGVELAVVAVIWFLPRLARPLALAQLAVFLPILIGDIALGAGICGCFGAVEVPPWLTLTVDVVLLLGVWLLGGHAPSLRVTWDLPTAQVLVAGLLTIAGFAFSFGLMTHRGGGAAAAHAGSLKPPEYFVPDYASWLGLSWSEVPIAAYVIGMPADLASGRQYVILYRKDCEHCHELMDAFFAGPLQWATTAIAIPERDGFPSEGVLSMPCSECRLAELPTGCDWFFQAPVLVRLMDGVVECAAEVDAADPQCLVW